MEVKELEGFEECDEDVFIDAYEIDRATLTIELGMKSLDIYFRRERDADHENSELLKGGNDGKNKNK